MLLDLKDISVSYGKVSALRNISIAVPEGKIVTIICGNGAGKTTTLRAMSGMAPLTGVKSISWASASTACPRTGVSPMASPMCPEAAFSPI
ncbi:MAG: ATP-binding cassette domain-containing protein [Roseovarius sp.]|nr:ATP-binding cassette domain-containing protein [Roseovarius sp.]